MKIVLVWKLHFAQTTQYSPVISFLLGVTPWKDEQSIRSMESQDKAEKDEKDM